MSQPCSVPTEELRARRQRLLDQLPPHTVVVLCGASLVTRSHDTEYPFRQSSDFFYLTGINEPEAVLLMHRAENPRDSKTILFVQPRDAEQEIWHGRRLGCQKAHELSAVDEVAERSALNKQAVALLGNAKQVAWVFSPQPAEADLRQRWLQAIRQSRTLMEASAQLDLARYIHAMRRVKSSFEIEQIRQSAVIAMQAHRRAMSACKPGRYEYELAAELHYEFALHGSAGPAYGTICGGGENACILHYTDNSSPLRNGDLLLIDAGCEWNGYASDITRTFPVNGKFSPAQRRVYDWVLKAQQACIEMIKPGVTMPQLYKVAATILTESLIDIGVLHGSVKDNLKNASYRPYFMHGLGHWLGLDVHDRGNYKDDDKPALLEPGMVLTIEPGLYIPAEADCSVEFRGVGIRIEDDVLVTDSGYENLTAALPVDADEIEDLMRPGAFT